MNSEASVQEWRSFVEARSNSLAQRDSALTRREQIIFILLVFAGTVVLLVAIVAVALALLGRIQTGAATASVAIIPAGGVAVLTSLHQRVRNPIEKTKAIMRVLEMMGGQHAPDRPIPL
jgi:hypothetical protein